MGGTEKKVLVVTARVKEINKAHDFNTSDAYIEALSDEVARLLEKGRQCATASGRKTLKPQDV